MTQYELPVFADERRVVEFGRSRDPSSLDLLYRAYAPALKALCLSRLGSRDAAEDATHEVILKAHAALDRFRPEAPLWPWLATIAHRVCSDMGRAGRRLAPLGPEVDQPGHEPHETSPEPDVEAERRFRVSLVVDAMRDLPERYRLHLYRRDYEGRTYEEMAAMDGTSVASVRSVLFRARRDLGDKVAELARRRGYWPVPAFVALIWDRLRARVATWRPDVAEELASPAGPLVHLGGAAVPLATVAVAATLAFVAPPTSGPAGPVPPPAVSPLARAGIGAGPVMAGADGVAAWVAASAQPAQPPGPVGVAVPPDAVATAAGPGPGLPATAMTGSPPMPGMGRMPASPPAGVGSVVVPVPAGPADVAAPDLPAAPEVPEVPAPTAVAPLQPALPEAPPAVAGAPEALEVAEALPDNV